MNTEKIRDLYGIKNEIKGDSLSPLEVWYNEMINKSVDELSIGDISRMLRQNVLFPLAISKAMELLIRNPLDGEMYDGDLLKQVVRALNNNSVSVDKHAAEEFIKLANMEKETYEWEFEEDKIEYENLLDDLKEIVQR